MANNIGHNQKVMNANSLTVEQRKQLKNAISELNDSMTRAAAERELQKETINNTSEKLGLDKKLIRRMAKVYFRANFNDEIEENNTFEDFYSLVIQKPMPTDKHGNVSSIPASSEEIVVAYDNPKIMKTDGWSNK